ncbi:hypothetical protein M1O54_04480 [Dehalococcoidia bacterium]|nr:hypothetical protein [Dehalococcoidia bacterium]
MKEFVKIISPSGEDALRMRIRTEKGKVMDIVVQYEAKFGEDWHPIVRYDCSHGFFHRDIMFPGGKEEKYPLNIPDLKTALVYAEQDIKDRWNWYRDRYQRRLKK